jgi:hypothetical protein
MTCRRSFPLIPGQPGDVLSSQYDDIPDARIDRGNNNDRTIRLTTGAGKTSRLPTPTRGLRPPSNTTLDDAVIAIRRRSGLTPVSRRAR